MKKYQKALKIFLLCFLIGIFFPAAVPELPFQTEVWAASKLAAPKITSVKAKDSSSITVKWNAVPDADGYRIYRKEVGVDTDWTRIDILSGKNTTSYADTGLRTGRTYAYTVLAYKRVNNKNVLGKYDKTGVAATTKMTTPKLVSLTSSDSKSATLTWKKTSGVDGYMIYRKVAGDKWQHIKTIKGDKTTSYKHNNLVNGITYYYTVKAYNYVNNQYIYSGYNKTGLSVISKTPKITKLTFKELSSTSLQISWPAQKNVDGYRIYRKTASDKAYTRLKTTSDPSITSYTDTGLEMGRTYYYVVRGYKNVNGDKFWGYYDKKGIAAATKIPQPKLVSASAIDHSSILVKWKKVTGADGYRIYRKAPNETSWTRLQIRAGADKVTFTDTGLTPDTKYAYTIIAYKKIDGKNVLSKYDKTGVSAKTKEKTYSNPVLPEFFSLTAGNSKTLTLQGTSEKVTWTVYNNNNNITLTASGNTSAIIKGLKPGKVYVEAKIDGYSKKFQCKIRVDGYIKADKASLVLYQGERADINITTNYTSSDIHISSAKSSIASCYHSDFTNADCAATIYGAAPGKTTIRIASESAYSDESPAVYIDIPVTVLKKVEDKTASEKLIDYLKRNGTFKNGSYTLKIQRYMDADDAYHESYSVSYKTSTDTFCFSSSIQKENSLEEITMNMQPNQTKNITAYYQYTSGSKNFKAKTTIRTSTFTGGNATFTKQEATGLSNKECTSLLTTAENSFLNTFRNWSFYLLSGNANVNMKKLGFSKYTG